MKTNSRSAQSRLLKQLRLGLSYCLSVASVLAISAEAMAQPVAPDAILLRSDLANAQAQTSQTQTAQAQTTQAQTDQAQTAQSSKPEKSESSTASTALRLQPFYNISHTEGAGFTGFTSFGGFFPLFQTPGQNVTFIDGRVSIDNDGNFGGGLQAGYRALLNDSTIWGAYAGLDATSAGDRTFTQAGVGAELLGENWDLTLNANIPLGNARQLISTDIQVANPEFTGNQLLVDEQQVDQFQAALTTVSLDGGLELFDFGEGSSLWGRGGVYFLGGEASEDSLGFRTSLDYRFNNNLRFGLGVQNDGVFDTNVIFSVNASFGSPVQRSYGAEETPSKESPAEDAGAQLWARAGESIARTNTVLVENQTDFTILQTDVVAINPNTNQAFVFQHVDPTTGVAVGAGTFEAPLDTIANAANIATPNADNIIFVQEGDAGGAFTLPDGVQVRSVGPLQQVNTQFGLATLPGSGSGNLPTVSGTVTTGNNTLVSGLAINSAGADGIVANGENIAIEDNVITNANRGIELPNIDGTVTVVRNQVSNTTGDGIYFNDIDGAANTTITVANNILTETGDEGIEFDYIENNATANITVANNQITNAQGDSIFFDDIEDNAVATIAVSENVINGGENDGIEFDFIENNANVTIAVNNNQINNTADDGIKFDDFENDVVANIAVSGNVINGGADGIEFEDIENRANVTINVNNNQISNTRYEGIEFDDIENNVVTNITLANNQINTGQIGIEFDYIENNANATIAIVGNTITSATEEGIYFDDIEDNAVANITIANNNILGAVEEGIEFNLIEDSATATINILNNQISNVGEEGIEFTLIQENANVTATVANNTISNPGGDGVRIEHTADTDFCLALDNNVVPTVNTDGFEFLSNGAGQFQVLNLAGVIFNNVGTFNPADIIPNAAFVNGTAGVAPCP